MNMNSSTMIAIPHKVSVYRHCADNVANTCSSRALQQRHLQQQQSWIYSRYTGASTPQKGCKNGTRRCVVLKQSNKRKRITFAHAHEAERIHKRADNRTHLKIHLSRNAAFTKQQCLMLLCANDAVENLHRITEFWQHAPLVLRNLCISNNVHAARIARALTDSSVLGMLWTKCSSVIAFLVSMEFSNTLHVERCLTYAGLKDILVGSRCIAQEDLLHKDSIAAGKYGKVWRLKKRVAGPYEDRVAPLVIKEIPVGNMRDVQKSVYEAHLLMKLSGLVGMNVMLGVNRVCVPKFVFADNDGEKENVSMQLIMDYAGVPLYNSIPLIRDHCSALDVPLNVALLSIAAQVLVTLHTLHGTLGVTHNDVHLKNITIKRWHKRMPFTCDGVRYVFDPPFSGDTVATPYDATASNSIPSNDEARCTAQALYIPKPCYLATLIDFGLASENGCAFNQAAYNMPRIAFDFHARCTEQDHVSIEACPERERDPEHDCHSAGCWKQRARALGLFMISVLTAPLSTGSSVHYLSFVNLDANLRDFIHLLLDLYKHCNEHCGTDTPFSDWLVFAIGRFTIAWLDSGEDTLTSNEATRALADIFAPAFTQPLFDECSRADMPTWQPEFTHYSSVYARQSGVYTVIAQTSTEDVAQKLNIYENQIRMDKWPQHTARARRRFAMHPSQTPPQCFQRT